MVIYKAKRWIAYKDVTYGPGDEADPANFDGRWDEVKHNFEPVGVDYESMTVKQLQSIAKRNGYTGFSRLNKTDLIALMEDN